MSAPVDAVSNGPLPPLLCTMVIAGLSALCWAVVIGIVLALRAWVG